jgi:hypothetical protein
MCLIDHEKTLEIMIFDMKIRLTLQFFLFMFVFTVTKVMQLRYLNYYISFYN